MQELTNKKHRSENKILHIYLAVLFAAAMLFVTTCAPGPLWQDSGHFQYRIFHHDIEGNLGLALAHPVYILIGIMVKYVPFGEMAFKINLISAIAGAVTIANVFLLIRLWLGKYLPAAVTALTFALSHTFWFHCTIAETYTLYTALFSAELLMLLQYYRKNEIKFLYWLALLNGLAIATHMWAIIPLSFYIVALLVLLIKKKVRFQYLLVLILLWCVGSSPYIFLIVKNCINTADIPATLTSAFFGKTWQTKVLNLSISAKLIKENLILFAYNFPTPNIILFFIAFSGLTKKHQLRNFSYLLMAMLALFFIFAFRYTVPDRFAFFIPFYLLTSIFVGFGAHFLITRIEKPLLYRFILILAMLTIPAYIIAPRIAEKMQFNLSTKRDIPFRNDYQWFLTPWKTNCYGPLKFAQEVFKTLPQNAAIYADSTTAPPLLYLHEINLKRKDIMIISSLTIGPNYTTIDQKNINQILNQHTLYIVSPVPGYCPLYLIEQCDLIKEGIIYRVVKKPSQR